MAHDVFISYAAKDRTVAEAACAALESEGIRCWIAPRDVLPGADARPSGAKLLNELACSKKIKIELVNKRRAPTSKHGPRALCPSDISKLDR